MPPETFDITIPQLGESITQAVLSSWLKNEGESVEEDDPVAELETDKVSVEVTAPAAGVLSEILAKPGETLAPGDLIARVAASSSQESSAAKGATKTTPLIPDEKKSDAVAPTAPQPAPAAKRAAPEIKETIEADTPLEAKEKPGAHPEAQPPAGPAIRKFAAEAGADLSKIKGSGKHGQITKEDITDYIEKKDQKLNESPQAPESSHEADTPAPLAKDSTRRAETSFEPGTERVVPMSPIRKVIASRLLQAQADAAILTTFNEVDMGALVQLRRQYKETFFEKHGVKLGYMGFFTQAATAALQEFPELGAEIRDESIVYKSDINIAIAVGGPKGLAVPVIRRAQTLSIAGLEKEIARLGAKVREGKISLEELQGGTFTITNGGVYGSMMSTPILNPPQSGILGMHKITERPVALAGEVVIRPMMYLALSYDHRIVDGKEAVQFLVKIKEIIEAPERLLLEL